MSTATPDITREIYNVAVTSASGSQAFPQGMANELMQIVVIPPNETADYELYIKEGLDDMEIFRRDDDIVGTYNEIVNPRLPVFGNNTFYIENATVNGNYKLRIVYK